MQGKDIVRTNVSVVYCILVSLQNREEWEVFKTACECTC